MLNDKKAQIIESAIKLLGEFKYETDEDSPSNSFFEARINEDWFFDVKHKLENLLTEMKTEEIAPEIFPGTMGALRKLGA